jgi:hypothetical protein
VFPKKSSYWGDVRGRKSSVGIENGYGAGGPRGQSSSPGRGKNFSPLHVVQIGSAAHPASYPMGHGGSFLGGKAAGAWSWPLNNTWIYTSTRRTHHSVVLCMRYVRVLRSYRHAICRPAVNCLRNTLHQLLRSIPAMQHSNMCRFLTQMKLVTWQILTMDTPSAYAATTVRYFYGKHRPDEVQRRWGTRTQRSLRWLNKQIQCTVSTAT